MGILLFWSNIGFRHRLSRRCDRHVGGFDDKVGGKRAAAQTLTVSTMATIRKDRFGIECVLNGIADAMTLHGKFL